MSGHMSHITSFISMTCAFLRPSLVNSHSLPLVRFSIPPPVHFTVPTTCLCVSFASSCFLWFACPPLVCAFVCPSLFLCFICHHPCFCVSLGNQDAGWGWGADLPRRAKGVSPKISTFFTLVFCGYTKLSLHTIGARIYC